MSLTPYLTLGGNCAEAFRFYTQHLGAVEQMSMPFRGSPSEANTPPEWLDKIMHATLKFGDQYLMASDGMSPARFEGVKNCTLSLSAATVEEATAKFNALAAKGTVGLPLQETFFAKIFGIVTDQFGVSWMLICEKPMG